MLINKTSCTAFKSLMAATVLLLCPVTAAGRVINVRGSVVSAGNNEPLQGVTIRDAQTERLIGTTNIEGKFTVSIDDAGTLLFSIMGSEDLAEPVGGRMALDVKMLPKARELDEVVVTAKSNSNVMTIDPAELDVVGNYIHLKKRVKIPHRLFSSNSRMIIQPTIYNVTRRHLSYLKPVVFDGHRYAITQTRMLDWDPSLDPLTPYREVKRTGRRTDDYVTIQDSLYVDNPKEDFMCVVMTSLENYNRVVYADTFMIARGSVNPLRFLSYDLRGYNLTDEQYLPQPEVFLRDSKGDINLVFEVGSSKLDLSMGNNASEIEKMAGEFRVIENDPDMTLKSFSISGTASPEGNYGRNLELANARMEAAMEAVMGAVPASLRRGAAISSEAAVASWRDVEEMLRRDGRDREADAVRKVVDAYPASPDMQSARMRRLPFYKTLLVEDYLPRLRKVSYEMVYSRYRPLTDEEIAALYAKDRRSLSKYNFWRYYQSRTDDRDREAVLREALGAHPDFLAAATDLSALLINRGEADGSVLEPFFADDAKATRLPDASVYDMAVAAMAESRYTRADSLMERLPDTEEFHKGKVYNAAMCGRYAEVVREISEDSPLNEVLLLLAMKDNATASERAARLGDSAVEEYVKAIAANRMDMYVEALVHLENALRLDPSLRDVARVDGDVTDLLQDIEASAGANE